jgi:hypothetical protein
MIKTTQELAKRMADLGVRNTSQETVFWVVSVWKARDMLEMFNTKDWAWELRNGIPSMSDEIVAEYLADFWEYAECESENPGELLDAKICEHFGI